MNAGVHKRQCYRQGAGPAFDQVRCTKLAGVLFAVVLLPSDRNNTIAVANTACFLFFSYNWLLH